MSNYLKASLDVVYSENVDYTDPQLTASPTAVELTPDECVVFELEIGSGAAETLAMPFSTATFFAVINKSTTNALTLIYKTASTVSSTVQIAAGGMFVTPDLLTTTAPTLQGSGATVKCKVILAGT